ncbi:MAG: PAS domain-containing sensor histidine kinase [Dehalococcoidia bacterium]|nr:PAS domain-containing sensor histidine kinase [Dehalococcoidia bacterium]
MQLMNDQQKTQEQLIAELSQARREIAELREGENRRIWVEEAISESEDNLRALVENAPDHIMILDHQGTILSANRIVPPFTPEAVYGKNIFDFIAPQFHSTAQKCFAHTFQTGEMINFEGKGVHPGFTGWWVGRVGAVKRGGEVIAVTFMNTDISQVKHAEDVLREHSQRLVEAQEAERRRIARELHDHIGGSLTGLRLLLEKAVMEPPEKSQQSISEAQALIFELMAWVRDFSLDLRPWMLDDLGLLPAFFWGLDRLKAIAGLSVDFEHAGLQGRFPAQVETSAYRIAQEALTNVVKHAGVQKATVRLVGDRHQLTVIIQDAGRGFDPRTAFSNPLSSGLIGMRERAVSLGGKLFVDSEVGMGTTIMAELPLREMVPESADEDWK